METSTSPRVRPDLVRLGAPDQPADQGLSSLGLLMALTGAVMAPLMGAYGLLQVRIAGAQAAFGGESLAFWWFLIGAASVGRSLVHRSAGLRLWRDVPGDGPALAGITTYLWVSLAHTALWLYFLRAKAEAPTTTLIAIASIFLAWPAAVWAVTRLPRFRALGDRPPPAEDNGFEGLAVLMAILGVSGLLVSVMLVWVGWKFRDDRMWISNILLLGGTGLVVRSALHAWVGVRAVRGTAVDAAGEFLRYGNLGVVIGGCVGGLFMLSMLVGSIDIFALMLGIGLLLALMAWPALVRRYVTWRHLADVATDTTRRRAPDAGITALGWLLLASAAMALSQGLAHQLSTWFEVRGDAVGMMTGAVLSTTDGWYVIPLGLIQLWAALEVLAVTPRRRVVASAWALLALLAVAIDTAPELDHVLHGDRTSWFLGSCALLLTCLPAIATLALVNRTVVPQAIARLRS